MAIHDWGQLNMTGMIPVEEETNRYIGFAQSVSTVKNHMDRIALTGIKKEFKNYPFNKNEIKIFTDQIYALEENANPIILLFHSKY